jgi:CBS domain-containing protein
MKSWERVLLAPESTLREALALIDSTGAQVALVVDGTRRLLGTLSDGDVRRGLLGGLTLEHRAALAMNEQPTCARETDDMEAVMALMRRMGLRQMPVDSSDGIVVGLQTMADNYPNHWHDFINDNEDAATSDVFLQCCLYGEAIFGLAAN